MWCNIASIFWSSWACKYFVQVYRIRSLSMKTRFINEENWKTRWPNFLWPLKVQSEHTFFGISYIISVRIVDLCIHYNYYHNLPGPCQTFPPFEIVCKTKFINKKFKKMCFFFLRPKKNDCRFPPRRSGQIFTAGSLYFITNKYNETNTGRVSSNSVMWGFLLS
jgi:hypothetical protein